MNAEKFDLIFETLGIYIKYMLGKEVSNSEEMLLLRYSQQGVTKGSLSLDLDSYLDESCFQMGDLILQFENPDIPDKQQKYKTITFEKAYRFFEKAIGLCYNIQYKSENLDSAILRLAFIEAYFQLKDATQDDERYEEIIYENAVSQFCAQVRMMTKLQKQRDKNVLQYEDLIDEAPDDAELLKKINNLKQLAFEKTFEDPGSQTPKEYDKKKNKNQTIIKQKMMNKGKFFKLKNGRWIRSKYQAQDFMTLSRNLLLLRLSQKGFKVRTFVSAQSEPKGRFIYAVLYQSDYNLQITAEQMELQKFLNLEFTDLLSLEPVNSSYRPLRLDNRLWRKDTEYTEIPTSNYFRYIKPQIVQLLKTINFKKMAKEVNIQQLNEQMFNDGKDDILDDAGVCSDSYWEQYFKYLTALSDRVKNARKEFYFKTEFALYFNAVRKYHIERNKGKTRVVHEYINLREVRREQFINQFKSKMLSRFKAILREGRKKWQDQEHIMSEFFLIDYNSLLTKILRRILRVIDPVLESKTDTEFKLLEALQDKYSTDDKIFNFEYFNAETELEECIILQALPEQFSNSQDLSGSDLNRSIINQSQIKFQYQNTIIQELQIKLFYHYLDQEMKQWDIDIRKYQSGMETLKTITKTSNKSHLHLSTKLIKQRSREILAQRYGNALREALQIANYQTYTKLKNIWTIGDFENLQISSEYYSVYHKLPKSKINSIMNIWQKYIISENGRISTFTIMERLKIINNIASQSINLAYLMENDHILKYYALNDLYELTNKNNMDLFDQDRQAQNSLTTIKTEISQSSVNDVEVIEKQLFVEPKLRNLSKIWRFRVLKPWYIPSLAIRNYYGEKIAIYYSFIGHYTYCLLIPGIIGLAFSLVQYVLNEDFTKLLAIIYGFYHASFLRVFIGRWQSKESSLAALFGASNTQKRPKQQERPSFQGDYYRDTVTDQLNTLYFPAAKLAKQIGLNTLLMIMVLCLYFGCIIGLFQLTYLFDYYDVFDSLGALSFLKLEASIPALINVIVFQIFDQFYEKLAQELTKNENHKTSEEFEEQYIMKRFSMQIVSYFAPLMLISFLSSYLTGFTCAFGSCFLHASYYFTAIFWILFLLNIQDVIQIVYSKLTQPQVITKGTQQEKINSYIETEGEKSSYLESLDIYGTVNDYLEIVTQACLLGLFGVFFPGSMFIAFIWNVLEIQTDKLKLIEDSQRPIPINEAAIGIWGTAIDILGNISLLYNSGLIYKLINSFTPVEFGFFIYVLLFNIVVSAILDGAFNEKSFEIEQIVGRQKYLLKSTIEMFKKSENFYRTLTDSKDYVRFPILKVYNTLNENIQKIIRYQQNDYSDISLENEVQPNQNQSQQQIFQEEVVMKKIKPIFCFNFPNKRFNNVKEQKHYNIQLEYLKSLLQRFEQSHVLKWSELQFIYRRYYIRREQRVLKNFNMIKLRAFLHNYNELFMTFERIEQGRKSKELNNDNPEERKDLLKQIKQYCKKKSHQMVRQVVIIKVKGVWFNQYRKQTTKVKAIDIMRQIKRIQIENAKKYNMYTAVTIDTINSTPEALIKDRKLIFNQVKQLDLTKVTQKDLLKLAVKSKGDYELVKKYKNTLVRNVEQLYSYEVKKIEIMQTQIYHIEFPEYLLPSQIALREIFCSINQKSQMRDLELELQYQLSSSYTAKYPKIQSFFKATRGYQQWYIGNSILETRDISLNESLTISSLQSNQYFNEWSLLDIFLYPSLKGIQATVINQKNVLPWTLKDTIALKKESRYKDTELDLLKLLLNLLKTVQPNQQRVLNITSIYAMNNEQISYHYSWVNHWNRRLNIKNYEFLCMSTDLHQQKGTPTSNQVYNIGIIILYVMTQGQGLVDISLKIEALEKINIVDMKKIIEDYLVAITVKQMQTYPILFTILLDILFSDKYRNNLKCLQALIASECQSRDKQNQVFHEQEVVSAQIKQMAMARLADDIDYAKISLQGGNEMIDQRQANVFHEHLTVDLYKIQTLFKLKCPSQMKTAINTLMFKLNQTFKGEWQEVVLDNLELYCGKYSKILCDLLNTVMFKSLMNFINKLSITDIKNGKQSINLDAYITLIDEDLRFIDKLKIFTSARCLGDELAQNDLIKIKKRLRVMEAHYKDLHFEFDQIISKLQYLRMYTTMLAQQVLSTKFEFTNLKPAQELSTRIVFALRKTPQEGLQILEEIQTQFHQYHKLKLSYYQRCIQLYLNKCTINERVTSECIFERILIHQHTVIDADILWSQNQEFQPYELVYELMSNYSLNKCQDLLIQSQILLLPLVDHLHYDKDMPLVEEALRLVYMSKASFQTYFLGAKLLNILNTQQGAISNGILCQNDQSTVQTEERYLKLTLVMLPVSWIYRDDLLSSFIFEVQARIGTSLEITKLSNYVANQNLQFRRLFIISKLHFAKEKYQEALKLFRSCLSTVPSGKELAPVKISRSKTMKTEEIFDLTPEQQQTSKIIYPWIMKCELFQSKIPSNINFDQSMWNHFFMTLIFDLKNLNAQMITRIMSRIILDQQLKKDDQTLNMNEYNQAQIAFVKLLLQEYLDQENKYIKQSFQVKHFILTTINKVLQDISKVKINESYNVEKEIQRRIQMNFQDPLISIKEQNLNKMNKILNDLIVVQSSLLEEIGDPIEALKCLDVQYAMMQYEEKLQKIIKQIFSRKLTTEDHEFAVTRCKIATFLLFQNLFDQSISSLIQIQKFTTASCQNIIHSLGEVRVSQMGALWEPEGIKMLHLAKQQQLEAFQTYKILFYQSQLKLLEAYTLSGEMAEALAIYNFLLPHYLKLPDKYIEALFEYSFGIYALNDWDIKMALLYYESALYNLDEQIMFGHQNSQMDKRLIKVKPLLNDSYRDFFASIQLEQDILQQLNHHFTLKSRCKLMYCQARLETENYPELFPIIVKHLENIRKTVGRTSILYVDTLLVYTEYLLRFKEDNTIMTILKSIFKAEYFISKKEHDYFKPGIYNDRSGLQSNFVFYQQEEIEVKFNEQLVTTWINNLLIQIKEFYTGYFRKVKLENHLSLVNCYLQMHRIAFCEKRISACMAYLQQAEEMLSKICPSMNHHLAIQIYVRYAMLCDNVNQIKENHIDIVLNSKVMNEFSQEQRAAIIEAILLNDRQIEEYFDKYYVEKFDIFLVKNLQSFLKERGIQFNSPQTQRRTKKKGDKVTKFEWIPTEQEKSILRHKVMVKVMQEPEKQPDYQRIGAIGFYRKAFMICNKIFKNENPLKTRVSDKFVELSSKEQRDMNNIKEQRESNMGSPKNKLSKG